MFSLKPCENPLSNRENHKRIFSEHQISTPLIEFFKPINASNKHTLKVFQIHQSSLDIEEEFLKEVELTSTENVFDTLILSKKLIDDVDRLI